MENYSNLTVAELMETVDYGLKAAKEMRAKDNNDAADQVIEKVCYIMDEIMRRHASIEI